MQCVAEAYLENTARLQPAFGMKTNVFAYAKNDLKAGNALDGKGGHSCYGLLENMSDNFENPGLPILISENLKLKRDIRKDERIGLNDVEVDLTDKKFALYLQAAGIPDPDRKKQHEKPVDATYHLV
jgi:predicted homoserine dehydrogenase-like protein